MKYVLFWFFVAVVALASWGQHNYRDPTFLAGLLPQAAAGADTLITNGLIVRYFIDEATSGTGPAAVLDYGLGAAFDLTLTYGGNLSYIQTGSNEGLNSIATNGTQIARKFIDDTSDKVRDQLNGSKTATLIVVMDIDRENANTGRIFGIGNTNGASGEIMLSCFSPTEFRFAWEDVNVETFNPGFDRCVLHIVINAAEAAGDDRIKVYKDGSEITSTIVAPIAFDTGLTLNTAVGLGVQMFNRQSGANYDRSVEGKLYYAALHTIAYSAAQVTTSFNRLTTNDDQP